MADEAVQLYEEGKAAFERGDYAVAEEALTKALPLFEQVEDALGAAYCSAGLGSIAVARSKYYIADEAFQRALSLFEQVGDMPCEAGCNDNLGNIALFRIDHPAARRYYERARRLYLQIGDVPGAVRCISGLGYSALAITDYPAARHHYERARRLYRQIGDVDGEEHCDKNLAFIKAMESVTSPQRGQGLAQLPAKIIPFSELVQGDYTKEAPPPRLDDASQDRMRDELTEDELIRHFRNASKETRLAVSDLLTLAVREPAPRLDDAAKETTTPATAAPRLKAASDLTNIRRIAALETLKRDSDLLNPELAEDERVRRARRLTSTYERIREREPDFHDDSPQIQAAWGIINKRKSERKLAKLAANLTR